jgi:hypothetical protein
LSDDPRHAHMQDEVLSARHGIIGATCRPSSLYPKARESARHAMQPGEKPCPTGCGRITTGDVCPSCRKARAEGYHLSPKADHEDLSADDLEARIAYYRDRLERKLPLFSDLLNAPFPVEARYK